MLVNISDIREEKQFKRLEFFPSPPLPQKNKNAYHTDIENLFISYSRYIKITEQSTTTYLNSQ